MIETQMTEMMRLKDLHHGKALENIKKAQAKQKRQYDLKHDSHHVSMID